MEQPSKMQKEQPQMLVLYDEKSLPKANPRVAFGYLQTGVKFCTPDTYPNSLLLMGPKKKGRQIMNWSLQNLDLSHIKNKLTLSVFGYSGIKLADTPPRL